MFSQKQKLNNWNRVEDRRLKVKNPQHSCWGTNTFAFKRHKMTNPQDHNSEVSSKQKFPKRRQNAEEERKRQEQTRHKVNGEKGDQLEAALSFFFFTLGIKLHQRAESQLIPYSKKTVGPTNPYIINNLCAFAKGALTQFRVKTNVAKYRRNKKDANAETNCNCTWNTGSLGLTFS